MRLLWLIAIEVSASFRGRWLMSMFCGTLSATAIRVQINNSATNNLMVPRMLNRWLRRHQALPRVLRRRATVAEWSLAATVVCRLAGERLNV
jgi:hypothetical protein